MLFRKFYLQSLINSLLAIFNKSMGRKNDVLIKMLRFCTMLLSQMVFLKMNGNIQFVCANEMKNMFCIQILHGNTGSQEEELSGSFENRTEDEDNNAESFDH